MSYSVIYEPGSSATLTNWPSIAASRVSHYAAVACASGRRFWTAEAYGRRSRPPKSMSWCVSLLGQSAKGRLGVTEKPEVGPDILALVPRVGNRDDTIGAKMGSLLNHLVKRGFPPSTGTRQCGTTLSRRILFSEFVLAARCRVIIGIGKVVEYLGRMPPYLAHELFLQNLSDGKLLIAVQTPPSGDRLNDIVVPLGQLRHRKPLGELVGVDGGESDSFVRFGHFQLHQDEKAVRCQRFTVATSGDISGGPPTIQPLPSFRQVATTIVLSQIT